MYSFEVYRMFNSRTIFQPLSIRRDWLDDLVPENHGYKCFPMALANTIGYGIAFPEDISFTWNGEYNASNKNVQVLKGANYTNLNRGWNTISFLSGIRFKTDPDVSMLAYPVPNQFIDGYQPFTTVISTSFYKGEYQIAAKITRPSHTITIEAGTPVIAVMPISLSYLNNSEAIEKPYTDLGKDDFMPMDYTRAMSDANQSGKFTNYYRDAIDHHGNKLGEHEVKSIKLNFKSI